ncbi:FERM domain-containing protein 3 isoform X2 [Hydra vulgaris]|uniref:FERM domain-containing protein 3 isoform X2 n=1 Tax=Hydra vulgaris TaxID=6087 RepID=UPI001F5FC33A|nr:FERM domain-containing protein 3 isoform X2 [Hydra vulgaris]
MKESKINLADISSKIRLLDDSEISFDFKKETLGSELLDFVCKHLDVLSKDYFGLRYVDTNKQRHWLKSNKEIIKQLKDSRQPYMFFFRVKFYPTDPTKVKEEITRYQLYLQLKRDILHGRLLCPTSSITELAGHIVQAELGDYNQDEFGDGYLKDLKLLPRQNEKLLEKIVECHKSLTGCSPAEIENKFLDIVKSQDLYGVDPHPCKDHDDLPLYLGLTPHGIQVIREAKRVSGFVWSDINKVSYDNKLFYIQTLKHKKKQNYVFCLNDTPSCKHLWKCTVEHMSFYSQSNTPKVLKKSKILSPQNLFRKPKPSGKPEHAVISDEIIRPSPPTFTRADDTSFEEEWSKSLRLSVQYKPSPSPSRSIASDNQNTFVSENSQKPVTSENHLSVPSFEINQPKIPLEETASVNMNSSMESLVSSAQMNDFKTEEFPDTESVCSSQDEDVSFDNSKIDVLSTNHNDCATQDKVIEGSKSETQLKPKNSEEIVLVNSSKFIDSFCSPLFVLILTAIIMIPLAVVLNKILN